MKRIYFPAVFMFSVLVMLASCAGIPENPAYRDMPVEVYDRIVNKSTLRVDELGWDPENSTEYLQAAFDSEFELIIIPADPGPWYTRELMLPSDKVILFEPGAELIAQRGGFQRRGETMLRGNDIANLEIYGYGAYIQMWKDDYQRYPYDQGEWRHGISLNAAENVIVEGLTITGTGGDGVYLGSHWDAEIPWNRDIVLRNLHLHDNHRQGISVISVDGLLIDSVLIEATQGTAPEAGIDFEPNRSVERLQNIVVSNAHIRFNAGPGILFYFQNLDVDSEPIDITIRDTVIRWNWIGLSVMGFSNNPSGEIRLINVRSQLPNFIWGRRARAMVQREE